MSGNEVGVTVDEDVADPDALVAFDAHRDLLFGVAYRMLGSVTEAEDVVQDTWLRWSSVDRSSVRSARSYLAATASRLAIDRLRSAQHRRETYVGPWLPEPLPTATDTADPSETAELADSATTAFLVMLERLNPVERAVFLLREVFGFDYGDVATVVDRSPDNCRQILRRARTRLRDPGRYDVSPEDEERLVRAFFEATVSGDVDGLVDLLSEDVAHVSDGGARVHAARRPVVGVDRVARFFVNLGRRRQPGWIHRFVRLGHRPGVVVFDGDEPVMAMTFDIAGGRISHTWTVANPDKLRHLRITASGRDGTSTHEERR